MIRCPKCEAELRAGAGRCPICGTPLRLRSFAIRADPRPDPVLDPLLDCFEQDELVAWCPECWNEHRPEARECRPCAVQLVPGPRSRYETGLLARPIADLGLKLAAGPPPVPKDLVRVRVADGLLETRTLIQELRFVGLEAWAGSDSLDPFTTPEAVGIYVHRSDAEAAAYVVLGLRAPDPLARPPGPELTGAALDLEEAREWIRLGKHHDALRILDRHAGDPDAEALAVLALLEAGRHREAEARAVRGASARSGPVRGRLLARAALVRALAPDGTAFGAGADLPGAEALLTEAAALAPRFLEAGKMLVEVLEIGGRTPELSREIRRLERLNPNLTGRDGWFRALRDRVRFGNGPSRPPH